MSQYPNLKIIFYFNKYCKNNFEFLTILSAPVRQLASWISNYVYSHIGSCGLVKVLETSQLQPLAPLEYSVVHLYDTILIHVITVSWCGNFKAAAPPLLLFPPLTKLPFMAEVAFFLLLYIGNLLI